MSITISRKGTDEKNIQLSKSLRSTEMKHIWQKLQYWVFFGMTQPLYSSICRISAFLFCRPSPDRHFSQPEPTVRLSRQLIFIVVVSLYQICGLTILQAVHGLVFALKHTFSFETLTRQQVQAFQSCVQSTEFTTGGLQSRWRNTLNIIKRYGRHLS